MERERIGQEIFGNDNDFEFCAHNITQNKTFYIFYNIKCLSEVIY